MCRHTEPSSPSAAVAALLRLLVQQLQESLQASRKNALEAARNVSAQGKSVTLYVHREGHSGVVITHLPPTSEIGVRIPAQPQVEKLVVACHW